MNTIRSAYKVLQYHNALLYYHTFKYKTHSFKSYSTHTLQTTLTLFQVFPKSRRYTYVLRFGTTFMHLTDNYG